MVEKILIGVQFFFYKPLVMAFDEPLQVLKIRYKIRDCF